MTPRHSRLVHAAALVLGVLPLWVSRHLPLVDLPQHLYLISVLHRLDDPTTLYPQLFAARHALTPYLGYYYLVSGLNWLLPLEMANRVFLSAYVVGLPLSLGFLLRSLGRPTWPALLALPFAYGDSFNWGFINYCAALPLTLLCCGLFVRTLEDTPRRRTWGIGLAVCLVAVLLFHVQAFGFLAFGLPLLLLTTRVPEDAQARGLAARLRPRVPALLGVVPGVALFLGWVVLRFGEPADIQPGVPWKAWGPTFSPQNLAWKGFEQNRAEFFQVLANTFRDGSDRWALYAVGVVAVAGWVAGLLRPERSATQGLVARSRLMGLGLLALALYFLLPFDIRGYVYYLNTRYAHRRCPPGGHRPGGHSRVAQAPARRRPGVRTGAGLRHGARLPRLLSRGAGRMGAAGGRHRPTPPCHGVDVRPQLPGGATARLHPQRGGAGPGARWRAQLHLRVHAALPAALHRRGAPTFPSEWRPQQMDYERQGVWYDHFLVRGASPSRVFGPRLPSELAVVAEPGKSALVRRR
ncbi:hypothetical protein QEG98_13765 [Myxococcus sp. MxC21-1]|nr:hypothetical protein QEG98_13765 [Myxococcus sp. MxC21-1]